MDTYALLRKISQYPEYECREEFRKNLTIITSVEGQTIEITVEMVEGYYFQIKRFLQIVKAILLDQEPEIV